ncbi:hypothetical protein EHQ16_10115 [Leptospira kanakyensis]|uniref:Uncharacterized protein n=1 Tax=Leptospira kanakyensis TaxID=2484968 RepID=A0A6N4Q285_9LEPT|nr:hypothetical protein EHQ11_15075 [Leptospira kanakyensis]TGK60582.1 hypothetical protein EHQ16_10115 [Leptospira kanakyensis]TGK67984.1 hypothetical protein EHQ18_14915 [Leptospira kanakyensis]
MHWGSQCQTYNPYLSTIQNKLLQMFLQGFVWIQIHHKAIPFVCCGTQTMKKKYKTAVVISSTMDSLPHVC